MPRLSRQERPWSASEFQTSSSLSFCASLTFPCSLNQIHPHTYTCIFRQGVCMHIKCGTTWYISPDLGFLHLSFGPVCIPAHTVLCRFQFNFPVSSGWVMTEQVDHLKNQTCFSMQLINHIPKVNCLAIETKRFSAESIGRSWIRWSREESLGAERRLNEKGLSVESTPGSAQVWPGWRYFILKPFGTSFSFLSLIWLFWLSLNVFCIWTWTSVFKS